MRRSWILRVMAILGVGLIAFGLSLNTTSGGQPKKLPSRPEAVVSQKVAQADAVNQVAAAPAAPTNVGVPIAVSLPTLGQSAPVVPIDGNSATLEPPGSPSILAWSNTSSQAGAPTGTTLIMGHVNWNNAPGVFENLDSMKPGDAIRVQTSLGWLNYTVVTDGEYPKGQLPAIVFSTTGSPDLALVTCGGDFNSTTGHYDDNTVVLATPSPV